MSTSTKSKHILIGGGSGFIGTALSKVLRARGDQVTLLSRTSGRHKITWDEIKDRGIPRCDVVINLAGKHILDMRRRWNERYKNEVIASRVETTEALVKAINEHPHPSKVFISTAGKCFYGSKVLLAHEHYSEVDERSKPIGMDFPADLVGMWEAAADGIDRSHVRHVKLRIGIVLASAERQSSTRKPSRFCITRGLLPLLRLPFSIGLGASFGKGNQPFPWVHIDDMVGLIMKAIDDRSMQGVYNVVAPGIVSNKLFTEVFAQKLRRPILWTIPEWLVRAIVGLDRSPILLLGQLVKPTRTLEAGYRFRFPDIDSALTDLTI